jgi:hypothetical protein
LLGAIVVVAGPQAAAFWMLGSQEAWAVPLAAVAVALIGRRRFALGLTLAVLAALVKEPFIPTGIITVAWAWRLGARRSAVVAGVLIATAGVLWVVAMMRFGFFYSSGIPLAARYLYPGVFLVAWITAYAAARSRVALEVGTALAAIGLILSISQASAWAAETRRFAGMVNEPRALGRPVLVTIGGNPEPAIALSHYLAELPVAVDPPQPPGDGVFATSIGENCIEVAVGAPRSACPTVVAWR